MMEDMELAAIREKVNQLNILMATSILKPPYMSVMELIAEDAPALLAEINRLRQELQQSQAREAVLFRAARNAWLGWREDEDVVGTMRKLMDALVAHQQALAGEGGTE